MFIGKIVGLTRVVSAWYGVKIVRAAIKVYWT